MAAAAKRGLQASFSVQINILQAQNVPAQVGYLPPEYASTSPVAIYDDEYLNAVYNPVPFLAFSDVTFPEIGMPTKEQPVEMMHHLRANWNELDRCRFDSCIITPTVFWCAQSSNYTRCKFIPGRAFESDTPIEVRAFVSDTTGDAPDKVQAGNPPTRAAVHISYAPQAFEVHLFHY